MNILLTGINNYLGKELALFFLEREYQLTCLVRNETSFLSSLATKSNLSLIHGDLIREKFSDRFPDNIDVAFYFSYYVAEQGEIYHELELLSLQNYIKKMRRANCSHLIYVMPLRSPVHNDIKKILKESYIPYTIVRTSNIVGKNSLLMEIFEKISNNVAIISNTRLASSKCQPIALSDAITYLDFIAFNPATFNQSFDLGGPAILSYRQMLTEYMNIRQIKKPVITLPFVHTFFSTFWLSQTSGLPTPIARAFNENIKGDILCEENRIHDLFPHTSLTFSEAVREALEIKEEKIEKKPNFS